MTRLESGIDVSRETFVTLQSYAELIHKWNPRINLVAGSTLDDLWLRHIVDSAQIFNFAPETALRWVDLGSGGGLPGVVCAVIAQEKLPGCSFTLVESDKRKAAFLAVCKQELGLDISVQAVRAEQLEPQSADIVTARALAPLPQLLPLVQRHLATTGVAVLPKGKNHAAELEAACARWHFDAESHVSLTDPSARILELRGMARV